MLDQYHISNMIFAKKALGLSGGFYRIKNMWLYRLLRYARNDNLATYSTVAN